MQTQDFMCFPSACYDALLVLFISTISSKYSHIVWHTSYTFHTSKVLSTCSFLSVDYLLNMLPIKLVGEVGLEPTLARI